MTYSRFSPASSLLSNGDILITGGYGRSDSYIAAEFYNPHSRIWNLVVGGIGYADNSITSQLYTLCPHWLVSILVI